MAEAMEISTLPKSPESHRIKLETVTVVVQMLLLLLLNCFLLRPFLRSWWIFAASWRLLWYRGRHRLLEESGEVPQLLNEHRSAGLVAQRQQGVRHFSGEEIFVSRTLHRHRSCHSLRPEIHRTWFGRIDAGDFVV